MSWVHLFDAPSDFTTRLQAAARAVRSCGIRQQPARDWFVILLAYASTVPGNPKVLLTDGQALARSLAQRGEYQRILEAMRAGAADAGRWKDVPGNA